MDIDDDLNLNSDAGTEDDDEFVELAPEQTNAVDGTDSEEFPYDVLALEQVVTLMVDIIKEVRNVVEVRGY